MSAAAFPMPESLPLSELTALTREVLGRDGCISFIATGGSMWPHIRHGDLLTARPLDAAAPLGTGWVVVYVSGYGRLAVHRVIAGPGGSRVRLRGDATGGRPEELHRGDILGRVVLRQRGSRVMNMERRRYLLQGALIARTGWLRVMPERLLRQAWRALSRRSGG